jgi:PHD/YefM family antitoxin component YafN of YafNO toxin-antitoxin module
MIDAWVVSLTEARHDLCPLVRNVSDLPHGKVGIAVRGDVQAYLVSARRLDDLERKAKLYDGRLRPSKRRLRGTLTIVGDLETGSTRVLQELEAAVSRNTD